MHKIFYLVIFILVFATGDYAQINPGTSLSRKDSLEILNQLMKLLDSADRPTSYLFANIGIGNRLFSLKNYALNAKQGNTNVAIFSPSIGYFHKSGLGLSAGASLLNDFEGFGINQYLVTPSFDLAGNKNIALGVSYTRYFVKNEFSEFSSPIQNDFFTSLSYKKTWVRPGIALGYSTGKYREARHKDTLIAGISRHLYDSVTYKLKVFSIMLTAGHQFSWFGVLDKSDGLAFTPTLMLNAGAGKTTISHKTNAVRLFNFLNKRGRIPKFQNEKFKLQSLGLSLDLLYAFGNFALEPQFYVDYYLQATDPGEKKITQVFMLNLGYTF